MPDRLYVARACTVVTGEGEGESLPLSSLRDREAYVLLGAPGAGKTESFKQEAYHSGGHFVRARDFITYHDRPEWHGKTLYIDGLDEKRAGSLDQRTPLDEIRAKLYSLGRPRFRLSCREADWFGASDRTSLLSAAPGTVDVLRLDPLTDDDVRAIVRHHGIADVARFMADARAHGVDTWMRNPHALEMLVESMGDGEWPTTRQETFERGCRALCRERNPEHRQATLPTISREEMLRVAGRLCAVLLLTGEAEYAADGEEAVDGVLPLAGFAEPSQETIRTVCRTLLFDVRDGRVTPRHRHVAEFLGGRYLARLVQEGLPVRRVLALFAGFDGGVVSELRGLAAWFAAFSVDARADMVERDPLGVVLYGDVKRFSLAEKQTVIRALEAIAARDPANLTLYREMDVRWGDLATEDMGPVFEAALADAGASETSEAVAVALLESLAKGARVPAMAPLLLDAVRDEARSLGIREQALAAYLNQSDDGASKVALARDIVAGQVSDPRDELLGKLLWHVYPGVVGPDAVADYFTVPKGQSSGWLAHFWLSHLPRASSREQLETVMDALLSSGLVAAERDRGDDSPYLVKAIPGRLLRALLKHGTPDVARLFDWLALIDPWRYFDEAQSIQEWFQDHPETFRAVFRMSVEREPDPESMRSVGWRLMTRIGAPPGFARWCAEQADAAGDARSASRLIHTAAAHWDGEPAWQEIAEQFVRRPNVAGEFRRRWEDHQRRIASLEEHRRPAVDERTERRREEWRRGRHRARSMA